MSPLWGPEFVVGEVLAPVHQEKLETPDGTRALILLDLDLRIPYAGEDGKPVKPESNNGPIHRKSIDHILGLSLRLCHT